MTKEMTRRELGILGAAAAFISGKSATAQEIAATPSMPTTTRDFVASTPAEKRARTVINVIGNETDAFPIARSLPGDNAVKKAFVEQLRGNVPAKLASEYVDLAKTTFDQTTALINKGTANTSDAEVESYRRQASKLDATRARVENAGGFNSLVFAKLPDDVPGAAGPAIRLARMLATGGVFQLNDANLLKKPLIAQAIYNDVADDVINHAGLPSTIFTRGATVEAVKPYAVSIMHQQMGMIAPLVALVAAGSTAVKPEIKQQLNAALDGIVRDRANGVKAVQALKIGVQ